MKLAVQKIISDTFLLDFYFKNYVNFLFYYFLLLSIFLITFSWTSKFLLNFLQAFFPYLLFFNLLFYKISFWFFFYWQEMWRIKNRKIDVLWWCHDNSTQPDGFHNFINSLYFSIKDSLKKLKKWLKFCW